MHTVSVFVPASAVASWECTEDCVLTGLQASMDALVSLDPDATWTDYVAQTGPGSTDRFEILTHSQYGISAGAAMFQLNGLLINLIKGQKIFVACGPIAGLVQLFIEPLSQLSRQLI